MISNRVWPSLDLKIEIWTSATKRLPTPGLTEGADPSVGQKLLGLLAKI